MYILGHSIEKIGKIVMKIVRHTVNLHEGNCHFSLYNLCLRQLFTFTWMIVNRGVQLEFGNQTGTIVQ